jgi:dTDP-4-amino-4,6-dideoxygalactose transaminase
MIPLLVPRVPRADQIYPYLEEIDRNQVYSNNGPLNRRLVSRLASYFGLGEENVVTLCNATLALEGALFTSPTAGRHWDMPSWTFTATPAAALNAERDVRFLDVDDEWRVSPDSNTRNLVDVLPFGSPLKLDRFSDNKLDCLLIDGAASFDSLKSIKLPISVPIGIVVSMHATKMFSAGEGGIFISNNPEWVADVKQWSNFGMSDKRSSHVRGTNSKLSEYAASVALATFDMWPQIRYEYIELSSKVTAICVRLGLKHFAPVNDSLAPYWILRDLTQGLKESIKVEFQKNEIAFRDWWETGTADMQAYSHLNRVSLENSIQIARTSLGLPFHTSLSETDLKLIEKSLANALSNQTF